MKKTLLFGLMAALAIISCQKVEKSDAVSAGKPFTAVIEQLTDGDAADVETKTSLNSTGNVLWKQGDQISIFAGSTINEQYQVTDASDGKTAAALYQVAGPGFVAGSEINNNVAFYPYMATAEIQKNGTSYVIGDIALPATQNYAQASFGNGAFPMTAVTNSKSDYNLKFKNVLGGLKLQLKGTATITAIRVTGNNNEKLCGAAAVTVSNTTAPTITLSDATAITVTLDCGDGVQLDEETATAFIIALPPMTMSGGFTVTVTDSQNKQMEIKTTKSQTITRSDLLSMPVVTYEGTGSDPVSEPVAVDLGLPSGLKWATFNLGANAPEEYGDYFAWGDPEPYYTAGHSQDRPCSDWRDNKTGYNWASYKFELGTDNNGPFSKYVINASYGTVDNNTELDPEDDAAYVNWGGTWRMPTLADWQELLDECTWTWTTQSGVNGRLVTSNTNGNSIFLPAAGGRSNNNLYEAGSYGRYWSSSLYADCPYRAYYVNFSSVNYDWGSNERCGGRSVRPVLDEGVRVSVTGVSLNKDNLELVEGGTVSLTATVIPSNATQPNVIWSSSNTSVATVDYTGKVKAVVAGSATITATTYDGGFTASCTITVNPPATINGHGWIDLGLTSGLKWATCDLGANAPEEYGDYFAWGETEPYYSKQDPLTWKEGKTGYNWDSYKWSPGDGLIKYCTNTNYGTVDNNPILDSEDDAAAVNWGGSWRMPTIADWEELIDECTWTWTTQNGVSGRLVTSNTNGNSIFLPAAGDRDDTDFINAGSYGYYWSSSLNTDDPSVAWFVYFYEVHRYGNVRYHGLSVRPVTDDGVRVSVAGVSLDKSNLDLIKGEIASLTATVNPSNATQPNVIWSSSDRDVAIVDYTGTVIAVAAGTATITAKTYDGGFTATCSVTVSAFVPKAVDLGLTSGLKWATCNVGAKTPEENGDYFAWGETEPHYSIQNPLTWKDGKKAGYDWPSYKFEQGTGYQGPFSKYVTNSSYGTVDNNTVLDPEDDAAAVNLGGTWRMPTDANWTELRTECTWTWTTLNGKNGYRVTSKTNSNSIFLPAAGYRFGTGLLYAGSDGSYWSSSLSTGFPDCALYVFIDSDEVYRSSDGRYHGLSVRPVTE